MTNPGYSVRLCREVQLEEGGGEFVDHMTSDGYWCVRSRNNFHATLSNLTPTTNDVLAPSHCSLARERERSNATSGVVAC